MAIEWHNLATPLIKSLDFYVRGLESVNSSGGHDHAGRHSYDVIDRLRNKQVDWEEGLVRSSAALLLMSVVPTHLCACYRLISNGLSYEARVLLRSLSEALDLIEFFNDDRCTRETLEKWVAGEIVGNRAVREKATGLTIRGKEYEIADEFRGMPQAQDVVRRLRALSYTVSSKPVHHSSDALLQAARVGEASSIDSELIEEFNAQLICSCNYFLKYFGDALPDQHTKAFRDVLQLLENSLAEGIPNVLVKLDPVLEWPDDISSPR